MNKISARRNPSSPGFTMLEMLMVVAILGIMVTTISPNVLNALEARALDTAAREILSSLQLAKWQAASSKLNHRLRFTRASGRWWFMIESEYPTGTWTARHDVPARSVSNRFGVTLALPADGSVVFQPSGIVQGFESARNEIALSSAKLAALGQSSRRIVRFFASGSVQFKKETIG